MARYYRVQEVNGRWSAWFQPVRRGHKLCCCDCGLVHDVDFRLKNGRIQLRASRNKRSTAQVRRWMK